MALPYKQSEQPTPPAAPRKRGRPAGSRNKPRKSSGFDFKPRKQRTPTSRLKDPAKLGKASKPSPAAAPRLEELVLRTKHSINGTDYGPGVVRVREDIAAMLREQEQRVMEGEARFHGRHAFLVGRGLKVREVPYETFQESAENATPIGTASKGGWENS